MLSNTQPSTSALVRVVLNELLGPAPLKGGQSCSGFEDKGTVNLTGVTSGLYGQVHMPKSHADHIAIQGHSQGCLISFA